jgi:hypothetical protein
VKGWDPSKPLIRPTSHAPLSGLRGSGGAAACFLLTISVWARLVTSLSGSKAGTTRAALNLGVSWLALIGAFILSVLTTISLVLAAKKVDIELELQAAAQAYQVGKRERRRSSHDGRHGRRRGRGSSEEAQEQQHQHQQEQQHDEERAEKPRRKKQLPEDEDMVGKAVSY